MSKNRPVEQHFRVETIFGYKSRRPLVRILYGPLGEEKEIALIPPEDAQAVALNLLRCSEASVTDAFLVSFLHTRVGLGEIEIVGVLREYREWRDSRETETGLEQ